MVTPAPILRRTVERRVVQALIGQKLTISTAEAGTVGLVAHRISSVPGASACFAGGVVAAHTHGWPALALSSAASPGEVASLLRERLQSTLAVCTCIISSDDGTMRMALVGPGDLQEWLLGPWSRRPTAYQLSSQVLSTLDAWFVAAFAS